MSPLAKTTPLEAKIMLQSGTEFDILDPWNSSFGIEDIARGLSLICRYVGQCREFYSVAEHSLYVSQLCPDHAMAALLHDAAEAFIGDVSGPLKALLPAYKRIEREVEAAIFARFDISYPLAKDIKAADLSVTAAEQEQVMPHGTVSWLASKGIDPATINIRCLSPNEAKTAFLERFYELQHQRPVRITRYSY